MSHRARPLPGFLKGVGEPTAASCQQWAPGGGQPTFEAILVLRENVLALDIFFEAVNYETVEQKKAYEMSELLGVCAGPPGLGGCGQAGGCKLKGDPVSTGDIGGQMGLFIGASLLTILEILDYLCEVGQGPHCRGWEVGIRAPRMRGKVCTGHLPSCLPPGVPRQGPGIFLEPTALPKALQHQSGNSPSSGALACSKGARPHP